MKRIISCLLAAVVSVSGLHTTLPVNAAGPESTAVSTQMDNVLAVEATHMILREEKSMWRFIMQKRVIILWMVFIIAVMAGCEKTKNQPEDNGKTSETTVKKEETTVCEIKTQEPQTSEEQSTMDDILSEMTLREKVGQLFIVFPESLDISDENERIGTAGVTMLTEKIRHSLEKYPVGGITLFDNNIETPDQLTTLVDDFQKHSTVGMFISIDEEGGRVTRIAGNVAFPVTTYESMEDIGNTGNVQKAKEVGNTIGTYLKQYGINLDFAPVSDVNTNPDNIVIGNRAFGSSPELVADMIRAAILGFHQAGIMTCAKHFPGHGDTTGDTHNGYVAMKKTWSQLQSCEIIPFRAAIEANTDFMMVSHITAPNITSDGLPASVSYEMVTKYLRNKLAYDGIVITDSMAMGAIEQNYTSSESAVMAIQAGVDIVLLPYDFTAAFEGVLNAVKEGKITEERIDESVRRILKVKKAYGLL